MILDFLYLLQQEIVNTGEPYAPENSWYFMNFRNLQCVENFREMNLWSHIREVAFSESKFTDSSN